MSFIRRNATWKRFVFPWVLLALLVACGAPTATPSTSSPNTTSPTTAPATGTKPVIKLAENPWTGAAVNTQIAKILLEEQLGYKVEVVTIDENAQWAALSNGDLSASLEIWPSGHGERIKEFIETKKVVENLGALGVVGKISWYLPTYMLEDKPELATWEGLKKPENAALFKTTESGAKGQFLAGDPSWVQYDQDIIKNLGMDFEVVRAGSEQAVLAALDAAYSRKQPILFYFWTPHAIHNKFALTPVQLPAYNESCYAKAAEGGVACDYPKDELIKIAWSGLKDQAPEAYALLKAMNYPTETQVKLIGAVELDKKSTEEVAREWVTANESTWKAWLGK